MINEKAMLRICELTDLYKKRWGKEVDLSFHPPGLTQEKLVNVLELIVDTGDSVLVGWNKLNSKNKC